ncbi:hypothetical protein [Alicyclobacillus acidiphilus]|uniref:hypothetical protein n=1 Tax=Alicyclobacillus acidiphilus TaxID=182455 RepID=UPI00083019D8|nr:hypothetical protein [Alicyclobacillus acidiphilus]
MLVGTVEREAVGILAPGDGYRIIGFKNVSIDQESKRVALDLWFEPDGEKLIRVSMDMVTDEIRVIDGSWDRLMKKYTDYADSHGWKRQSLTPEGLSDGLRSWAKYKLATVQP